MLLDQYPLQSARMNGIRHPWNSALALLAAALLGYAWRLQDLFPVVDHVKPVTLITGAFLLVLLVDRRLQERFGTIATRPPAVFAVALGGLALFGVPFSLYGSMSLNITLKELIPAIALMIGIAAATRSTFDAYRLSAVHVIGALIFSLVILTRYSVGESGRLGDLVYYDANDLGLVLICTLPLAEWMAVHGSNLAARLGALATIGILLLTIIKTGSRGAFLGLITVVIYGIFANGSAPFRRRLTLAAMAIIVLASAAGTQYWTMMNTLVHPTKDYNWVGNDDTGRMTIWKRGIGYMMGNPITGVGVGAFPVAEGTISQLAKRQEFGVGLKWSAAHNSFIQIGAELGFPGLIVFLAFLIGGFFRAREVVGLGLAVGDERVAALGDALAASMVGFAVSAFFLSEAYKIYIYSIIGITIGLHTALRRSGSACVVRRRRLEPESRRSTAHCAASHSDP